MLTSPGSAVIASDIAEALDKEVVSAEEALVSVGEPVAKGPARMDEMSWKGYVKSTEHNLRKLLGGIWIGRRSAG